MTAVQDENIDHPGIAPCSAVMPPHNRLQADPLPRSCCIPSGHDGWEVEVGNVLGIRKVVGLDVLQQVVNFISDRRYVPTGSGTAQTDDSMATQ